MKNKLSLQKIFNSKLFIAVIFLVIGVFSTVFAQNIINKRSERHNFFVDDFNRIEKIHENFRKNFFNDDFFDDDFKSIMKEMKKFEQEMNKNFVKFERNFAKFAEVNSDENFANQIKITENNDEIIYILNFSGFNKDDIIIETQNDKLILKSEYKNKKSDKNSESKIKKSFYYEFLLPKNYDEKELKIDRQENKITIKIDKNK